METVNAAQQLSDGDPRNWFCVRAKTKNEHIAAAHLRLLDEIEIFNPRIKFKRPTRRGPVWFLESLFPGYLFVRFNWRDKLRAVQHTNGVFNVVHFGNEYPIIEDGYIEELRAIVGKEELRVISNVPKPGDEVKISGGAFHGLLAVVQEVMPARQRVAVLMDFLGRQTRIDVSMDEIVIDKNVVKAVNSPPPEPEDEED